MLYVQVYGVYHDDYTGGALHDGGQAQARRGTPGQRSLRGVL